jgi:OmpA-OmpF porin, OOP family
MRKRILKEFLDFKLKPKTLFKSFLISILSLFSISSTYSTNFKPVEIQAYNSAKWVIGIGWNAVDDDGRAFKKIFDVPGSWNTKPYPTMLSLDRYLNYGFTFESCASFNQYNGSKLINGQYVSGLFLALDFNGKYNLEEVLSIYRFDPYLVLGMGLTMRTANNSLIVPTANVLIGTNIWFGNIGIRLQSAAKFGVKSDFIRTNTNYLQHSAFLLYRFSTTTRSSGSVARPRYNWVHEKSKVKKGKK